MTERLETSGWYSLGIPLYAVLLAVEAMVARRRGIRAYAFEDTLSDLSCGLGQLLFGLFSGPVILALYAFGYRLRIMTLPDAWWVWPLALIGVDACYYAYHRAGHRVAVLWSIHNVHHQSAELNFAVALRQTWVSDAYAIFFYWPLPLLGVSEVQFFAAVAVLSLYQITLHSRVLAWRGFGFFNTPGHHGLHHATNERYLDKNFGSMTLIWDRLFGTHAEPVASDPPRYGSPEGLPTHDGVLAQVVAAQRLVRRVARAPRGTRLQVLFGPPGPDGAEAASDATSFAKPGPAPLAARRYAALQFTIVVIGAWVLLWGRAALSQSTLAVAGVSFIAGLWGIGGVLDGRPGHRRTEMLRLGAWLLASLVLAATDPHARALAVFFLAAAAVGAALLFGLLPAPAHPRAAGDEPLIE